MEWYEIINNPFLQNLPFKIEMNKFGQVLMSPASNQHGIIQHRVGSQIERRKKGGVIIIECSIQTSAGVQVAVVAWASDEFIAEFGNETLYPQAPELCVEIVSHSSSKAEIEFRTDLYLARGAHEVWVVNENGQTRFFTHSGELKKSKLVPRFKL